MYMWRHGGESLKNSPSKSASRSKSASSPVYVAGHGTSSSQTTSPAQPLYSPKSRWIQASCSSYIRIRTSNERERTRERPCGIFSFATLTTVMERMVRSWGYSKQAVMVPLLPGSWSLVHGSLGQETELQWCGCRLRGESGVHLASDWGRRDAGQPREGGAGRCMWVKPKNEDCWIFSVELRAARRRRCGVFCDCWELAAVYWFK